MNTDERLSHNLTSTHLLATQTAIPVRLTVRALVFAGNFHAATMDFGINTVYANELESRARGTVAADQLFKIFSPLPLIIYP